MQAYALNRVIERTFPKAQVEHIAYLEKSHWDSYYRHDIKSFNNFNYNWHMIPHCCIDTEQELERYECDILITGADSIWEEIVTGVINHDWHLAGKDMNGCRHIISYAPSSGIFDGRDGIPAEMVEGLKAFDGISVRDKTTQNLIKLALGITPKIVLDPALLWDFQKDENIIHPSISGYIAVYGGSWNETFIEQTRKFANEKQLKLISIGFVNDWCDISFRRIELRAFEWIGMFACAEYVVTSTFHGLMLGINFQKQIKFCRVEYVKNRSQSLCEILEIPNHMENYNKEIDYTVVQKKLKTIRSESLTWLESMITKYSEG